MMPTEEVVRVINALESHGLQIWLDGGWGVDALVGKQTRQHEDLDIAILLSEADVTIRALADLGYKAFEDEMPTRLDLRDAHDHRVDLHPLTVDDAGNGLQQLQDGRFGTYTAEGLTGTGMINGKRVRCLSRDLQLRFHAGYELDDADRRDIKLLEALPANAISSEENP